MRDEGLGVPFSPDDDRYERHVSTAARPGNSEPLPEMLDGPREGTPDLPRDGSWPPPFPFLPFYSSGQR